MNKKAKTVDVRVNTLYPDRIESNAMGVLLALISVIVAIILLVVIVTNFSYAANPERVSGYTGADNPAVETVDAYEDDTTVEETDEAEETEAAVTEEIDAAVTEETEDLAETGAESGAVAEEVAGDGVADETTAYIIADSDSRYLTVSDLEGLTAEELRIARNEIYARHGRMFDDETLQAYFNSMDWYTGTIAPEDFTESMLNDYERENTYIITDYETEMGYR